MNIISAILQQPEDVDEQALDAAMEWALQQEWPNPEGLTESQKSQLTEGYDPLKHPRGKDGKFVPNLSKISTAGWANHSAANWAKKKIATLEALAFQGKFDEMQQTFYIPNSIKLNSHQKQLLQAQANLLQYKSEMLNKDAQQIPANTQGWKQIGGQLGTEDGGTFLDPNGNKYYLKTPDNAQRAHNEVLAFKLYEAAGGHTVSSELVDHQGKKAIATRWMDGSEKADWDSHEIRNQASKDFALHAWTANWDAVGAGFENPMDNIKHDSKGQLRLVDAGGALEFKGMGGSGKKPPGAFGSAANEWDTLRDKQLNPSSAKVFGGMTPSQLVDSAKKLNNVTDSQIKDIVNKYHGGTDSEKANIAATLIARKQSVLGKADQLASSIAAPAATTPTIATPTPPAPAAIVQPIAPAASVAPMAVPPPPTIKSASYASYQVKVNKIHQLAQAGDIAGIHAIATNSTSKHHTVAGTHAYKLQVLAALQSGGKAEAVSLPPIAKDKTTTPKPAPPKLSPTALPIFPAFNNTNPDIKAGNEKAAEQLKQLALDGNIGKLTTLPQHPSAKVNAYKAKLISALSDIQPPPVTPPKANTSKKLAKLSTAMETLAAKTAIKAPPGAQEFGYWVMVDKHGDDPHVSSAKALPKFKDKYNSPLQDAGNLTFQKLISDHKSSLISYTGSSHTINTQLRQTNAYSNPDATDTKYAKIAVNAVKAAQVDIPKGTELSRWHYGSVIGMKPGDVVADRGILSTSTNPEVFSGRSVQWRMTVGPGVKGVPMERNTQISGEHEILLPPNQRLVVTKVTPQSGHTVVHATVMPYDEAQLPAH